MWDIGSPRVGESFSQHISAPPIAVNVD
jgi:hypothetical protein